MKHENLEVRAYIIDKLDAGITPTEISNSRKVETKIGAEWDCPTVYGVIRILDGDVKARLKSETWTAPDGTELPKPLRYEDMRDGDSYWVIYLEGDVIEVTFSASSHHDNYRLTTGIAHASEADARVWHEWETSNRRKAAGVE